MGCTHRRAHRCGSIEEQLFESGGVKLRMGPISFGAQRKRKRVKVLKGGGKSEIAMLYTIVINIL